MQVVDDIKNKKFPNDFKGSSLEFVLTCITEQKQVFEGASHPFYWKPKLRIPDIYENESNKKAFGQFLENCLNAKTEDQLIKEIILPPFNTAIMNGFNFLFKDKKKLGSWSEYLKVREVLIDTNNQHRSELSSDLGAIAGLLFEIGPQKLVLGTDEYLSEPERKKLEKLIEKRKTDVEQEKQEEDLHTEMQYHLLKIGNALGYDVIAASNDRSRQHCGNSFSFMSLQQFPEINLEKETLNTVKLIDVLWFQKGTNNVISAFEVEKSTSIYSGILRLTDLSHTLPKAMKFFILLYLIKEKRMCICNCAVPPLSKIMYLLNTSCFLNSAATAMHFVSLAKVII
jgi:type II restriction enzyme